MELLKERICEIEALDSKIIDALVETEDEEYIFQDMKLA